MFALPLSYWNCIPGEIRTRDRSTRLLHHRSGWMLWRAHNELRQKSNGRGTSGCGTL